ncbi:MAG: hypothetical protein JXR76_22165 [Deltaproteobacteria bacterium]|nr:hypothetical protein [Deltaproteobacteria bacterium]
MAVLRTLVVAGMFILTFSLPGLANGAASEHGASAAGEHDAQALNWMDLSNTETPPLVPMFFNFIVVAGLVYLLMRKSLSAKIRGRKEDLEKALAAANALKKEAEEALAIARDRNDALDVEMAKIRSEVIAAAKAQAAHIEKEATARAERMRRDAETVISQEVATLAAQIRRDVVEEIVAMAEKKIVEKLSGADHDRLAKEYVSSVMSAVQTGK